MRKIPVRGAQAWRLLSLELLSQRAQLHGVWACVPGVLGLRAKLGSLKGGFRIVGS